jgi:hypothetical protein
MGWLQDQFGDYLLDQNGARIGDGLRTLVEPGDYTPVNLLAGFAMAVGPRNGSPVAEVTSFDSVTIKWNLLDGPTVSFGLPGSSEEALYVSGLATDLWIFREETTWLRCRVLPVSQSWGAAGEDWVRVDAVGYRQLVDARFLHAPLPFTDMDQGEIIWQIIEHIQAQPNGDLGITKGPVLTGIDRTRSEYVTGDSVGAIVKNLVEVIDGGVPIIGPGLTGENELSVRLPSQFPAHSQPAVWGGNCTSMERKPSAFANSAFVDGTSGGEEVLEPVWYDHPSIATDPRGRWETALSPSTSVTRQETVYDLAVGTVSEMSAPPYTWTLNMRADRWLTDSSYQPGHFVKVRVPATTVDPLDVVPVEADEVTIQVVEVTLQASGGGATAVTVVGPEVTV